MTGWSTQRIYTSSELDNGAFTLFLRLSLTWQHNQISGGTNNITRLVLKLLYVPFSLLFFTFRYRKWYSIQYSTTYLLNILITSFKHELVLRQIAPLAMPLKHALWLNILCHRTLPGFSILSKTRGETLLKWVLTLIVNVVWTITHFSYIKESHLQVWRLGNTYKMF